MAQIWSVLTQYPITFVLLALFLILLFYVLWLKYRMAVSKARFALAAIGALTTSAIGLLAFLSGPLPVQIVHAAALALGLPHVAAATAEPGWASVIAGSAATMLAMGLIYRFSIRALQSWDGPVTVTVNDLTKREQDGNLAVLAAAEFRRLIERRPDPIANDAAVNWQHRQSEAPASPPWHQLARSLFMMAFNEASIVDAGWRDRYQMWTGEIFLGTPVAVPLFLMIFDLEPTADQLEVRLKEFIAEGGKPLDGKVFALFQQGQTRAPQTLEIPSLAIELLPRHWLLRKGLRLDGYARSLIRRFNNDTLGGTTATLSQTFVEAHVTSKGQHERIRLIEVLSQWLLDPTRRHLALTGEYGQGKSTAMLAFCVAWANRYIADPSLDERIPFLIELRGKNPAETDPVTFLSAWTNRYPGLEPQRVYDIIRAGEAIVIFEGFDELRNAGRAYDRHEHFNALWRMAFPGTKVIFTGRPNFFLDEAEKNRTLRSDELHGAGGGAYTHLLSLDRLSENEVQQVANGFGQNLGDAIIDAVKSSPPFFDIVSRPSMLPVVATIWDTITTLRGKGYGLTGAMLLELYIRAVYRRKEAELEGDQRELLAPDDASYLLLPREVREVFSLAVVWKMVGADARNTISRRAFNLVIGQIYDDVLRAFQAENVPVHLVQGIRRFEERFKHESRADRLERISNEVATAGLFVPDAAGGPSNLCLPHKQFYEYLIAKAGWTVMACPLSATGRILQAADRSKAPLDKILSEELPIYFLGDILGNDFSIFRSSLWLKIAMLINTAALKMLEAIGKVFSIFGRKTSALMYEIGERKPDIKRRYDAGGALMVAIGAGVASASLLGVMKTFLEAMWEGHFDSNLIMFALGIMLIVGFGFLSFWSDEDTRLVAIKKIIATRIKRRLGTDGPISMLKLYSSCISVVFQAKGGGASINYAESTEDKGELRELVMPVV